MNREKETVMITEKQYLEYLIKQYQNLIYSICLKSVGNPFDAEDLTQEVFLSAYKNLSRFDGTYEKAWLSKIAVRKCLDYLKAAGRRSIPTEDTYFSQIPDRQSSPEDEYMKTASNTHVEALCMQLKSPYKEVASFYIKRIKGRRATALCSSCCYTYPLMFGRPDVPMCSRHIAIGWVARRL